MTDLTVEQQITAIRDWLRYHGDYGVRLDLWASYGTIRVDVTHLGRVVFTDIGERLEKRLDKAAGFLGIHTGAETASDASGEGQQATAAEDDEPSACCGGSGCAGRFGCEAATPPVEPWPYRPCEHIRCEPYGDCQLVPWTSEQTEHLRQTLSRAATRCGYQLAATTADHLAHAVLDAGYRMEADALRAAAERARAAMKAVSDRLATAGDAPGVEQGLGVAHAMTAVLDAIAPARRTPTTEEGIDRD